MKTILVVDDDRRVRAGVRSALEPHRDAFTVLEASHGAEAVRLIETRPVDLVVTDLLMPVMDGFQFLARLMSHQPTLPVLVLSSQWPGDGQSDLGRVPQVPCLSKPVDAATLLFEVRKRLQAQARGRRAGVRLLGFLQLLARERKTCMLEIGSGERTGTIHVLAGEVVHAKSAGQEGEEALFEMLGWREPRLHMVPALSELKLTIATRVEGLLTKALTVQEEEATPVRISAPLLAAGVDLRTHVR